MWGTGTKNRVFCVLYGEHGTSDTKELFSDDVKCFQSASITTFIISTWESLGKLTRVSIWHDKPPYFGAGGSYRNSRCMSTFRARSEPLSCWYVNRVTVVDMHTCDLYDFPVFEWIGPGYRDGRTDRMVFRRKAKSFEKCIKKELLSVALNSLESFSPFVLPRFQKSSATHVFLLLTVNLLISTSLVASYFLRNHSNKVLITFPNGVLILHSITWVSSCGISFVVNLISFLLYWPLIHTPKTYSAGNEYYDHASNQNSLTKVKSPTVNNHVSANDLCSPTGDNVSQQKWWNDIQTWAQRAAEARPAEQALNELAGWNVSTPANSRRNSRRNSYHSNSRETLTSQFNSTTYQSGTTNVNRCGAAAQHKIPNSLVFVAGFSLCIFLSCLCSLFNLFFLTKLDRLDLVLALKLFTCSTICSSLLFFPISALVCAFLSAVISWSFKFPLQLRFVLQLSHACSPILKSSPTRKSFPNDIFDVSDSVTSSCLALALRQRARFLKYVRPPELQSLKSVHTWALQLLKVWRFCRMGLLLVAKALSLAALLWLLSPSGERAAFRDNVTQSFLRQQSDDSWNLLDKIFSRDLQIKLLGVWFQTEKFYDSSNLTQIILAPDLGAIDSILFYYPVYKVYGAVTRERNASGHWQARTVTVQLDWPTSVAVGVCYMQLFAFTWLCIQFRVLILSATRNFTLLDLNLISHVIFPVSFMALSVLLSYVWQDCQSIKAVSRSDAAAALSLILMFEFKLQNLRSAFGLYLFFLIVTNVNLQPLSQRRLGIARWILDSRRSVVIKRRLTFTLSSTCLFLAVVLLRMLSCREDHKIPGLSIPKGIFLFACSPVVFILESNKSAGANSGRQSRKKLTLVASVFAVLRFYSRRLHSRLKGTMEYSSLTRRGGDHVTNSADPTCKRYHVPLRLECLMEELEKQVDELLFRTMTLTGQLKQPSESPYSTWTSAGNENTENKVASRHQRAQSFDQNQLGSATMGATGGAGAGGGGGNLTCFESKMKFSTGDIKSAQCAPTLMQLRLLASSSANLDERSRDNVLECLEEVVYNRLCGQYEFLFEKEFELELLLSMLITEDDDQYWKLPQDVGSTRRLTCTSVGANTRADGCGRTCNARIRSHSAAALVRFSGYYDASELETVTGASMRTASSEDKLSSLTKASDGLVQPIKIVYPSSSYEKSKTVKLHRLCQDVVVDNFRQDNASAVLAKIKLSDMKPRNYSDQCLVSNSSTSNPVGKAVGGNTKKLVEERLRNLSGSRVKLHRTRTVKGGVFLEKF